MNEVAFSNIDDMLSLTAIVKSKQEEDERHNGTNFNIFKIMKMETDEVFLHSALIAELLNSNGTHNKGSQFLRLFLERMITKNVNFEFDVTTAKIEIEKSIGLIDLNYEGGGRIDIVISDKNDSVLIIENKIYANDQPGQLLRYKKYGQKHRNHAIFYLTLYGTLPDKLSVATLLENQDYFCISYKYDIVEWLNDCVKIASDQSFLRETLNQYIATINYLTNHPLNVFMVSELIKLLKKNNNFLYINEVTQAYEQLKIETQYYFWQDLIDAINLKLNGSIKLEKQFSDSQSPVFIKPEREVATSNLSLLKNIENISGNDFNIVLRFTFDNTGCYYGFMAYHILNKTNKHANENQFIPLVKYLKNLDFKKSDWHLGWKYFSPIIDFIRFNNQSAKLVVNESDSSYRKNLINDIAESITEDLMKLEKFI